VVQKAEVEDMNMVKVDWMFDLKDTEGDKIVDRSFTVTLRHGRRTGIRKIYVNKELVERSKDLLKMVKDNGGAYQVPLTRSKSAEIEIINKGSMQGFQYKLSIDDMPIEQQTAAPGNAQANRDELDIGTRAVQLPKSSNGLGMTLRNNPLGPQGVVVWTVEPGKVADQQGIQVGDVVLSVEDSLVNTIDNLVDLVAKSVGVVNMEIAGTAPSKIVELNARLKEDGTREKYGLGLQTTSCGVGILVTEIDPNSAASNSALRMGDCLLSVEGLVPNSPKEAVRLIIGDEPKVDVRSVRFVVINSDPAQAPL